MESVLLASTPASGLASRDFHRPREGSYVRRVVLSAVRLVAVVGILATGVFAASTARAAATASGTASVAVEKVMPPDVLVGRTFEFAIKVTNLGDAELQDVVLTDRTEGGARVEEATPKADQANGPESTWRLGTLGARQTREVRVRAVATGETPVSGCATATFRTAACATTQVLRPAIELSKTLPATARLCERIPVKIVVRNSGTSVLQDVRITDALPEGLTTETGDGKATFEVGRLSPGQNREVVFQAKASRTGRFVNTASATSAEGAEATANAEMNVVQPVLAVQCRTPALKTVSLLPESFAEFVGRPFEVCWEIANTGDAPSDNSTVEVTVPNGVDVRSAADGGSAAGRRVTWNLGSIAPGANRRVCATFVASVGGEHEFKAAATGLCATAVQTACSVPIQAVNAILVELVDDPDPIQVGERTTYTVRVTHQGGALDLRDVAVVARFPEGLEPSAPSHGGQVQGRVVTWAPVPAILPKQSVTYTVVGKGTTAGDHRLEVEVTTRGRKSPITEIESTTVY